MITLITTLVICFEVMAWCCIFIYKWDKWASEGWFFEGGGYQG